jgi:hypothetical protein
MELSNKSLALLLVISLIISLGGTLMSLTKLGEIRQVKPLPPKYVTGLAAGKVDLTISNSTGCNIDYNVSFGSGIPLASVILSTATDSGVAYGFNNCTNSTSGCYYAMPINNTGNTWLNVTMQSNVNASNFTDPAANWTNFIWYAINGTKAGTAQGCQGANQIGTFGYVNSSNITNICFNLSYVNGADVVTLGWNVTVNETTPKSGVKNASITITCAQSSQT